MIDPSDITKFDRTDEELELFWLFSTIVAGKTAATHTRLLEKFLNEGYDYLVEIHTPSQMIVSQTPFQIIANLKAFCLDCSEYAEECMCTNINYDPICDPLRDLMATARIGQYTRLTRCWRESLSLDLRNDPLEAFEAIHGVGPKTARMFIMHSRPNQRVAALDTHLLKYLEANGHIVPKATPSSIKQYHELENAFLTLADAAGESPADHDLRIWKSYAKH
jgi:hypothetical protein